MKSTNPNNNNNNSTEYSDNETPSPSPSPPRRAIIHQITQQQQPPPPPPHPPSSTNHPNLYLDIGLHNDHYDASSNDETEDDIGYPDLNLSTSTSLDSSRQQQQLMGGVESRSSDYLFTPISGDSDNNSFSDDDDDDSLSLPPPPPPPPPPPHTNHQEPKPSSPDNDRQKQQQPPPPPLSIIPPTPPLFISTHPPTGRPPRSSPRSSPPTAFPISLPPPNRTSPLPYVVTKSPFHILSPPNVHRNRHRRERESRVGSPPLVPRPSSVVTTPNVSGGKGGGGGGVVQVLSDPVRLTKSLSTPSSSGYRLRYSVGGGGRDKSPWDALFSSGSASGSSRRRRRRGMSLGGEVGQDGGGGVGIPDVAPGGGGEGGGSYRTNSSSSSSLSLNLHSSSSSEEGSGGGGGEEGQEQQQQRRRPERMRTDSAASSIFRGSTPTTQNIVDSRRAHHHPHNEERADGANPEQDKPPQRPNRRHFFPPTTPFVSHLPHTTNNDSGGQSSPSKYRPYSPYLSPNTPPEDLDDTMLDLVPNVSKDLTNQTKNTFITFFTFAEIRDKSSLLHLCIFCIFGTSLRITLGRIFGKDCESNLSGTRIHDFISYLSTCVTSSGTTTLRGGALFIDLPANIVGSFFLGILTPSTTTTTSASHPPLPPLPWLSPSHRHQSNAGLLFGLRVAFCGSLTTFASWNTQMVVMMVGRDTEVGERAVVPALFGYGVGLVLGVVGFWLGREAGWGMFGFCGGGRRRKGKKGKKGLRERRGEDYSPMDTAAIGDSVDGGDDGDEEEGGGGVGGVGEDWGREVENIVWTNTKTTLGSGDENHLVDRTKLPFPKVVSVTDQNGDAPSCLTLFYQNFYQKYFYFFLALILFSLFIIGDYVLGYPFYRQVWISSLFALPGSLLRWNLSFWNGQLFPQSERIHWIPWGTLTANALGCVVSVVAQGLIFRFGDDEEDCLRRLLLVGVKAGLGGNISTVSTFVKEIVQLHEKYNDTRRSYIYAAGTIVFCCVLSLCIYLPMSFTS